MKVVGLLSERKHVHCEHWLFTSGEHSELTLKITWETSDPIVSLEVGVVHVSGTISKAG